MSINSELTSEKPATQSPPTSKVCFGDIMIWLKDESIIRFETVTGDGRGGEVFLDVVITGHGMNLLGKRIDALNGASAADVIMETKDKNASAPQLVKLGGLIGGIIGGFTKSAS
ncbi:hypothetical protein ACVWW5_004401 [Bradyrhizobium sp. LM3.4]